MAKSGHIPFLGVHFRRFTDGAERDTKNSERAVFLARRLNPEPTDCQSTVQGRCTYSAFYHEFISQNQQLPKIINKYKMYLQLLHMFRQ